MTKLEEKMLNTFNTMIDIKCEEEGVAHTIFVLHNDYDFTKEELIEMNFDERDIERVFKC